MGKGPPILPRLSLFFLICLSCAWAGNGAASEPVSAAIALDNGADIIQQLVERPAPAENEYQPTITPPPTLLLPRQDQNQGQIQALSNQLQQVSSQFRSVSQASQQVSQSSQQLSQSLQQATQSLQQASQRLSQTEQQLSSISSASRALSQSAADASRSASQAFESKMASVTREMGAMGASFSSALRAARESAASVAQVAQDRADEQVQMAQGAALSVTQTALAVVGGVVGSSVVTAVVVVLVLRRRGRRGHSPRGTGFPQLMGTSNKAYSVSSSSAASMASKKGYYAREKDVDDNDNGDGAGPDDRSSTYSTDDNGVRFPSSATTGIQQPLPAMTTNSVVAAAASSTTTGIPRKAVDTNTNPVVGQAVGYAVGYYARRVTNAVKGGQQKPKFQLGNPPPPREKAAAAVAAGNTTSGTTGTEPTNGKFTLFPSPQFNFNLNPINDTNNKPPASTTKRGLSSPLSSALSSSLSPTGGVTPATAGGLKGTSMSTSRVGVGVGIPSTLSSSMVVPGPAQRLGQGRELRGLGGLMTTSGNSNRNIGSAGSDPRVNSNSNTNPNSGNYMKNNSNGNDNSKSNDDDDISSARGFIPTLERWLRDGTDVSPFSTLQKQDTRTGVAR